MENNCSIDGIVIYGQAEWSAVIEFDQVQIKSTTNAIPEEYECENCDEVMSRSEVKEHINYE